MSRYGFYPAVLFVMAAISVTATSAAASDTLDIQQELSMPGVKLVVVEFYATWCKPCMEAVPKWKALHDKYRKHGLRFIVVSAEGTGTCNKPPDWSPDKAVCDEDETIKKQLNVKGLPQSYLYSWQGNLALTSHEVEPIQNAIDAYFKNTQLKLQVDQIQVVGDKCAVGGNPEWLRGFLAGKVREQTKFDVVSVSGEAVPVRGSSICEPEFPPNSVLRISLEGDCRGHRSMTLAVEKDGCTLASATESYKGQGLEEDRASMEIAATVGIGSMMNQLVNSRAKKAKLVGKGREGKIGYVELPPEEEEATVEEVVVKFDSDPSGAVVLLDGKMLCKSTPCSKRVVPGGYKASMQAENYIEKIGDITAARGAVVSWKLDPDFGWITITSEPQGLDVKLDGEVVGKTPINRRPVSPKNHEVLVISDCYYEIGERAIVERGFERKVSVQPIQKTGKVKVTAQDKDGNDIEADVYVDGTKVGIAPGAFKVNVCSREIEVKAAKLGSFKAKLAVAEKQTAEVAAVLKGGAGVGSLDGRGIEWVSIPAGSFMMGCSSGDSACEADERPRHSVNVKAFSIMSHEVTQREYRSVIGNNPGNLESCGDDCPVGQVNWHAAKAFCQKIGGRLPTEAEWEYAARAGTTTKYYCGESESCLDEIAWYDKNSGSKTHQAKKKQPNIWGLYDTSGNVWEWVEDCYSKGYNSSYDCSYRVLRGGSWNNPAGGARVSGRNWRSPDNRYDDYGVRCSRDDN